MATASMAKPQYTRSQLSYKHPENLIAKLKTQPAVINTIRERGKWDDPALIGMRTKLSTRKSGKRVVLCDALIQDVKGVRFGDLSATDLSRLPDPSITLEQLFTFMRGVSSHPSAFTMDTIVTVVSLGDLKVYV